MQVDIGMANHEKEGSCTLAYCLLYVLCMSYVLCSASSNTHCLFFPFGNGSCCPFTGKTFHKHSSGNSQRCQNNSDVSLYHSNVPQKKTIVTHFMSTAAIIKVQNPWHKMQVALLAESKTPLELSELT